MLQFIQSVHQIRVRIEGYANVTAMATSVHAKVLIREPTANASIPLLYTRQYSSIIYETVSLLYTRLSENSSDELMLPNYHVTDVK